ncbi:MAG: hypothetical protein ACOCQS_00155 [Bacillota bacterium]
MKYRYIIPGILLLLLFVGISLSMVNYYSFDYLYSTYIKGEFKVNHTAEIDPERDYNINIWFNPFYRTIDQYQGKENEFFDKIQSQVKKEYPNINLKANEVNFLESEARLSQSIEKKQPPDIYFNFTNDSLINEKFQIPVDNFLTSEEEEKFKKYEINDNLWGWPLLVQPQNWLGNNKNIEMKQENNFMENISSLKEADLIFNYRDYTLLRQLMALKGVDELHLTEDKKLTEEVLTQLHEVFLFLHQLRKRDLFGNSFLDMMDENFVKSFIEDDSIIIGPLNPWLEHLLNHRYPDSVKKIKVDNLIRTYTLNVFYQEPYKGDDHIKAVMEVSRIITQEFSQELAKNLDLQTVDDLDNEEINNSIKILEITPQTRPVWENKIIPAWLDFWEKGLTPEETMEKI